MSFSESLLKNIEKSVNVYISIISSKYNIDEKELCELWGASSLPTPKKVKTTSKIVSSLIDTNDLSFERLSKATCAELTALCKSKSLKSGGKKQELIDRLMGVENKNNDGESKKKSTGKKQEKAPAKKSKNTEPEVIKKIMVNIPEIVLRKNTFGNFEHPPTSIVFDASKQAYGKQEADGSVSALTPEDIETCKKYKFTYKIPDNLDKNTTNVTVEELESDSDIEIPEEKQEVEIEIEEGDDEEDEDEDEEEDQDE